jgi:hypothetical protein
MADTERMGIVINLKGEVVDEGKEVMASWLPTIRGDCSCDNVDYLLLDGNKICMGCYKVK